MRNKDFHLTLPKDKVLDLPEFKKFSDDNIIVTQHLKFTSERAERAEKNIVIKQENAGYQHFLLFPQCFQKLSFDNVGIVW